MQGGKGGKANFSPNSWQGKVIGKNRGPSDFDT